MTAYPILSSGKQSFVYGVGINRLLSAKRAEQAETTLEIACTPLVKQTSCECKSKTTFVYKPVQFNMAEII